MFLAGYQDSVSVNKFPMEKISASHKNVVHSHIIRPKMALKFYDSSEISSLIQIIYSRLVFQIFYVKFERLLNYRSYSEFFSRHGGDFFLILL